MAKADIGLIGLAVMAKLDFKYGKQGLHRRLLQSHGFKG